MRIRKIGTLNVTYEITPTINEEDHRAWLSELIHDAPGEIHHRKGDDVYSLSPKAMKSFLTMWAEDL